jgi:hypothetical protein
MGNYSKWECGSGGRGRRARGAASVWGPRARGPPRLSGDSQAERWGRGSGGERTGGFQRKEADGFEILPFGGFPPTVAAARRDGTVREGCRAVPLVCGAL